MNLRSDDREGIAFGEVPGVTGELSPHIRKEPRGSKDLELLLPVQHEADQGVEANKMVDVGMGDEGVGNFQELGRAKRPHLPQVEDQRAVLPEDLNEEGRIFEWGIDQFSMKEGFQKKFSPIAEL
jgi:hypothetical protein